MTDMEISTTKELKSFENIPFSKIYWKDYLEAKDYNKDINKMCSLCQEKQIADHGEITIECRGLAGASMYIDDRIAGLLSEEELAMTEQMANPYAWAAANISSKKFKPRWYQEMVSRCTSKRMSLRCGRRAGKALAIDTPIPTPDGWRTMEDISIGDNVFDEHGDPLLVVGTTEVMTNRDCYEVSFSDNTSIVADAEHLWTVETKKIRKSNSRNKVKRLLPITITTAEMSNSVKVGSKSESNYSIKIADALSYPAKELIIDPYVLGFWLGEGCRGTGRVAIDPQDIDELTSCIIGKGYPMRIAKRNNDCYIYNLITDLKKLGVEQDKFVPRCYLEAEEGSRMEILRGLMDSDGTIDQKGKAEFTSSDRKLSEGVYELVVGLGMKASLTTTKSLLNGKEYLPRYRVYFNPNKQVFNLKRKAARVITKNDIQNNRYITEIKRVPSVPVKCIEVDSASRLYLASKACIPTHNSYSLGLRMLHRAMTTECKILVVTPYEIQAEELMNIILEFIWALDPEYGTYASVVDKFVKSPTYLMRFLNKSRIRAFTTGSSGAGSVRGQAADVIVLDEVDYMTTADFNSILAILMDNPDVELWVASTPNGKSQLHRLENLAAYKGFHFPSYVLPHYNDVLDAEFKDQFDDIGYVQEVMAEFGEADATVFQGYFIDKNTKPDLNMPDVLENRDDYIVILGGDWNDDKNGTRLLAVAFNRATKEFHVCDQRRVSKEGWTQIAAVQEIIEFNRKYDFEHIYLDEGYGTSNIQFIKQYGLDQRGRVAVDHPDIKLSDVVGINFSSKIEVIPAGGGEMIKKDMKTYLVENSVRLLERDAIKFDKELDDSLIDQMRNYVILRRSPTGKPIYGTISSKIGDHDLDAFMVALLGWSMEYSSLLTHTTSDTLVNLVSRDKMNGSDTPETETAEYLTGADAENELFASSKTKVNSIKLFNSKINRYNRASFSEHAGNGKGRPRHKGRARSSYR